MVAVALAAEVRPLPMPMEPEAAVGQVGGTATTPGTSTGIESVDDHIARLKANARQHVDREMLAAGSEASVRAAKTRGASTFRITTWKKADTCYIMH